MGMNASISQKIAHYLADRQQQGLYRTRVVTAHPTSSLDFSCNDYLSLGDDPRIRQAYSQGFQHYPAGSGGSMVLCGYHAPHRALEQAFAQALQVDDCLLFSSGYVANLSVVSLLIQFGAHILIDKAIHASVYDGLGLVQAQYIRFLHNDLKDLQRKLAQQQGPCVVLTESTFSMSGQQAPLREMASLLQERDACLIVDEAHGFGIMGQQGLGGVVAAGLSQEEVPLRIIPFGKALGGSGAIVAGKALWIDALLQATRQPVYSTSISPAYAYGLQAALARVREADDRRGHLQDLIDCFRQFIKTSSLLWRDSISPIQQLQLGCPFLAQSYAQALQAQQIRCFPIRQPTVSKHDSGLRIILNYHHREEDIARLFQVLSA